MWSLYLIHNRIYQNFPQMKKVNKTVTISKSTHTHIILLIVQACAMISFYITLFTYSDMYMLCCCIIQQTLQLSFIRSLTHYLLDKLLSYCFFLLHTYFFVFFFSFSSKIRQIQIQSFSFSATNYRIVCFSFLFSFWCDYNNDCNLYYVRGRGTNMKERE